MSCVHFQRASPSQARAVAVCAPGLCVGVRSGSDYSSATSLEVEGFPTSVCSGHRGPGAAVRSPRRPLGRRLELHIDGVGVSQVLLLKDAHQQVCDYLDTIGAKRPYNIEINAAEQ